MLNIFIKKINNINLYVIYFKSNFNYHSTTSVLMITIFIILLLS